MPSSSCMHVGKIWLSNTAQHSAFVVLLDDMPVFFSETRKGARIAIDELASVHERELRDRYTKRHASVVVSRDVLSGGDRLVVRVQHLGTLYNSEEVSQTLRVVELPWLDAGSPVFSRCGRAVDDDEDEGTAFVPVPDLEEVV